MKWLSGDAAAVSHRLENTGDTVNANWQRRAPPKRSTFKASDKV